MQPVTCELPVDYVFEDSERESLYKALQSIKINPYRHYPAFTAQITRVAQEQGVADRFIAFMERAKQRDQCEHPFLFIKNAPVDKIQPIFDFVDPVQSKHFLKRTFIAEGFLALFATLDETTPIGYLNVNDGDVFQDIYPKESMKNTQSQKALGEIYFHKDLANHFVRPDYVNILAMRSHSGNETLTTFVRNIDIIKGLPAGVIECLTRESFHTPFDDLSVAGNNVELGEAERHAIINSNGDVRYFENRTVGLDDESARAVEALRELLHERKRRVHFQTGDFVSIQNNWSLHGKEIGNIAEPEVLRTRWMIKTVNVRSADEHTQHMVAGTGYLVNG